MSGKGIGPAVFETAGKRSEHYLPGPYSRSLAKGGATGGVSANNGAILGRARGGEPRKLFVFTSAGEARETLLGGELLEAVSHAFDASRDYRPQRVMAMVVNGNSQAKSAMFSGDEEVLRLKTSAYGSPANGLSRRLCAGSRPGTKKLELACGGERETLDGIGRKSLRLRYSGNSPFARISVSGDGLSVETEEGTRAFSFEDFPNIGSLASRLNDTGEFAAEALDNPEAPSADLDLVEGANAKSADVTLASDFRALVEALESSGWIGRGNVEIVAGNRMPDDDDDPAFFEGASAGGFTMGDWGAALAALEAEDVQVISTHATDAAVHALIGAHCANMSSVENRKERTAILGGPLGETVDEAVQRAAALDSSLVSYCHPGIIAKSPLDGETEKLPASYFACKLLGMECSMAVNEPLTWKTVGVLGFATKLTRAQMEKLIMGGVLCGGLTDDGRLAVMRAMTTYRGRQLQLAERSMVREDLYMNRDLRMRYGMAVGTPGVEPGGDSDEQTLRDAARDWKGAGLIVPDDEGNNVWDIETRAAGDVTLISFHRNLTTPRNFFFITAFNHVYESAATVAI
ncbi:MAG: hypothetical protein FWE09_00070 [Treponema sp.]|nr:hypothetical protein [Treponema sp.]